MRARPGALSPVAQQIERAQASVASVGGELCLMLETRRGLTRAKLALLAARLREAADTLESAVQ